MDNQTPPQATPESLTSAPAGSAPVQSLATPQPVTTAPLPGMPSASFLPGGGGFGGSSSFGGGGGGGSTLMFALIGILGLGAIVFGLLAVVNYNKATVATRTLNTQVSAAVTKAKDDQQKADQVANTLAGESPFRSYVAPVEDGSFEIKFPKDWASYVDQEQIGTQIKLVVNPDFVRRTNNTDELQAARIELIERSQDAFMQAYTSYVKRGILKQADITVSGLKGFDITGQFADKKTTRLVVVPVRDKVLVFTNENSQYANEFNQILAQAKVVP